MLICEIGLNHLGDNQYCNQYIKKIIRSKADALTLYVGKKSFYKPKKFSTFILDDIYYKEIVKKIHKNKLKFGVMISDDLKIDFFESINTDFYKVFSRDILNFKLISRLQKTNKKIFISTGMSDLNEIKKFVKFIKNDKNRFTLIHTQLNDKIEYVNLKAIPFLKKNFNMNIAFGNHSKNLHTLYVALGFEPSDIFFYVKGNKTKIHPDEYHAINLDDLKNLITNLRDLRKTIGTNKKQKTKNEIFKKFS